jgi:hypothetical protein
MLIKKSSVFWDITPCSPLKVSLDFRRICRLHLENQREAGSKHRNFGKPMEETCSSETPIDFHRTTWRCIPEDTAAHNHCCENLKYYDTD